MSQLRFRIAFAAQRTPFGDQSCRGLAGAFSLVGLAAMITGALLGCAGMVDASFARLDQRSDRIDARFLLIVDPQQRGNGAGHRDLARLAHRASSPSRGPARDDNGVRLAQSDSISVLLLPRPAASKATAQVIVFAFLARSVSRFLAGWAGRIEGQREVGASVRSTEDSILIGASAASCRVPTRR